MSRYAEDVERAMIAMYLEGFTYADIANRLHLSEETARRRVQAAGIPPRKRGALSPAKRRARSMRVSCPSCGERFPVSVRATR